jgi:hypothetical protein
MWHSKALRLLRHTFHGPGTSSRRGALALSYFNDTGDCERLIYRADFHEGGCRWHPFASLHPCRCSAWASA